MQSIILFSAKYSANMWKATLYSVHQDKLVEGKEDPDIWVRRQHESTALGRGGVLEKYTRYKYQREVYTRYDIQFLAFISLLQL